MTFQIFNDLPQLPPTSPSDAGKEVVVNSSGAFDLMNPQLPPTSPSDAGKEVVVNSSGGYDLRNPLSYVHITTSTINDTDYTDIIAEGETPTGNQKESPINLVELNVSTITPRSTSSRFKLHGQIFGSWTDRNYSKGIFIKRIVAGQLDVELRPPALGNRGRLLNGFASTENGINNTAAESLNFLYVDEPATTTDVKYEIYILNTRATGPATFVLNRLYPTADTDRRYEVGTSTFIVQEI